ncbi:MAG: DUF4097 family beta strand repeat protein [Dehalococcoidia bacterium]|nr:DUF4097 family beta strand repeat protein [Dehalococcoidia bacterium]
MDIQRYPLPVALTLRLQSRSGRVHVVAEPRDDIEAQGERLQAKEEDGGATLHLRAGRGSAALVVRCPAGADVVVGTHSGDVRLEGEFGDVSITTMSGRIELEAADQADLRTMSADITLGACRVSRASTISGAIRGGRAGSAVASSMSGSISFEHVRGAFRARSVAGSVEASCDGEGAIAVKTVSGTVRIALPAGTRVEACCRTMSGHVECGFPAGGDLRVDAMSVSGSIEVVPT